MTKIYKYDSNNSVLEAGHWIMVTPVVADISFPPISVMEVSKYIKHFSQYLFLITYPGVGFLLNI